MIANRDRVQRELCAQIVLGKEDPAKMAIAKMDLAERSLGPKRALAKSQSARCEGALIYGYGACDAGEGKRVEGSKR